MGSLGHKYISLKISKIDQLETKLSFREYLENHKHKLFNTVFITDDILFYFIRLMEEGSLFLSLHIRRNLFVAT